MATLVVQGAGVEDNWISQNSATTNHGTHATLFIGEETADTSIYRALIRFDISSIPAGSTITSAVLTLTIKSDIATNTRTLRVYRSKRAWVELESTWNIYSTGNNWVTAGGADADDNENTDIGSASVAHDAALDSEVVITLTADKIQEMITGGVFTNNGFYLTVDTETDDGHGYYSTDDADSDKRPKLVVTYSTAGQQDYPGFGHF